MGFLNFKKQKNDDVENVEFAENDGAIGANAPDADEIADANAVENDAALEIEDDETDDVDAPENDDDFSSESDSDGDSEDDEDEEAETFDEAAPSYDAQNVSNQAFVVESIFAAVDETREQIERLRADFQNKLKYDRRKDEQIDALYAENREYRNDLIWTIKKSLLEDLVALVDSLDGGLEVYRDAEPTPERYAKLLKYVDGVVEDLLYALEKHDVVSYREPEGAPFNPSRQRAVEVRRVDDPAQDRATLSKRRGYEIEGKRIVRKEGVVCFRHEPKTNANETQTTEKQELNEVGSDSNDRAQDAFVAPPTSANAETFASTENLEPIQNDAFEQTQPQTPNMSENENGRIEQ